MFFKTCVIKHTRVPFSTICFESQICLPVHVDTHKMEMKTIKLTCHTTDENFIIYAVYNNFVHSAVYILLLVL